MKEIWLLRDDCGHAPYIFADRETPYQYIKKNLTDMINRLSNQEEKDDLDMEYLEELRNDLAELEEDYAEGGDFSNGMWCCRCYKIYQKGEMPEF